MSGPILGASLATPAEDTQLLLSQKAQAYAQWLEKLTAELTAARLGLSASQGCPPHNSVRQ